MPDNFLKSCPKNWKPIVYTIVLEIVHNIVHDIVHESVHKITQRLLGLEINEIESATGKRPTAQIQKQTKFAGI